MTSAPSAVLAVGMSALAAGCGRVELIPVTVDNHLEATGPRYYMTRPFVAVSRPFPIDSHSFLVDGVVTPDGRWVRVTGDVNALDGDRLRHALARDGAEALVPATVIFRAGPDADPAIPRAQGEVPLEPPEGPPEPESAADRTGLTNVSVRTELNSLPHFPVNEHFNLVFLPDFEREFHVRTTGGLGIAKADLKVGPGSTLLEVDADVDNSAIVGPITRAWKTLADAGAQLARAAMAASSGIPLAHGKQTIAAPLTTATDLRSLEPAAGTPITLRVHLVRFACTGLYPIVKPDEIERYTGVRDELQDDHYLVPVAQYQVPYKYFEVIVFEHVFSTADPTSLVGHGPAGPGSPAARRGPGAGGAGAAALANTDDENLIAALEAVLAGSPSLPEDLRLAVRSRQATPDGGFLSRIELGVGSPGVTDAQLRELERALGALWPGTTFEARR